MKVYAITGGPGAGKTTLIERLAALGHAVVPEAAILEIERLIAEHGLEGQREWRRQHPERFQLRVARHQADLERVARAAQPPLLFCDRGVVDGAAYLALRGLEPGRELASAIARSPYDGVFVLDTPDRFVERAGTGRNSTREDSLAIRDALLAAYGARGYRCEIVPNATVEQRLAVLLARVGAPE